MTDVPQKVAGWELKSQGTLPTFNAVGYLYEHAKHKCPFLVIREPTDTNNVFAVTLRTIPSDDSGIFHMLEHLTLQGSERYPIPDLFNELLKRSYSNFMNAFTAPEWTMFPFASTNEADFHNAMMVYLDTVFHPSLTQKDFDVECYRLEFEDNDAEKPLKHSGVVYNEMCGACGQPASVYHHKMMKHIYPDASGRFNSGGDPDEIIHMTLEKAREKHDECYHPANALFFTYGNFNVEKILQRVHDVIEEFDVSTKKIDCTRAHQDPWDTPRKVVFEIPMPEMQAAGDKATFKAGVAWVCPDVLDDKLMTDLTLLDMLLNDTDSAPMHKALIKSGIGHRLINGFDQHHRTSNFAISVDGVSEENAEKIDGIIMDALKQAVEEGFTADRIEGCITQWELAEKTPAAVTGVMLCHGVTSSWIHGVDPFLLLDSHNELARVRREVKENPKKFEQLIQKYLIDNKSRVHVIGKPVEGYMDRFNDKMTQQLAELKSQMTEERKQDIVQKCRDTDALKNVPKPVEKLPKIHKTDLKVDGPFYKPDWVEGSINIFKQPVREMTHLSIILELDHNYPFPWITELYEGMVSSIGAGEMNNEELAVFADRWTTGCSAATVLTVSPEDPTLFKFEGVVRSSCLDDNFDKMLHLMRIVLLEPHFNAVDLIKTKITTIYSRRRAGIQGRGHSIARGVALAGISKYHAFSEMKSGITFVNELKRIVEGEKWEEVSQQLQQFVKDVILRGKIKIAAYVSSEAQKDKILPKLVEFSKLFDTTVVKITITVEYNFGYSSLNSLLSNKLTNLGSLLTLRHSLHTER